MNVLGIVGSPRKGGNTEIMVEEALAAAREAGAGQTRVQFYGWFLSQGMVLVRGAIGYGREKGDVKTGDGGNIGMTALEEASVTGWDVVAMAEKLT